VRASPLKKIKDCHAPAANAHAHHIKHFATCSAASTVKDLLEVVRQYPAAPQPEIFGLHDNADITCDQNETYDLFSTVLSLQPRQSAAAGMSREDSVMQQCSSIADRLPEIYDIEAVQSAYPTTYKESMNTVLLQECVRCDTLLL
jgi:dynein heavy chain, axonemal